MLRPERGVRRKTALAAAAVLLLLTGPAAGQEPEGAAHPPPAAGGAADTRDLGDVTRRVLCPCGTCVNQTLHECTCGTAASERDRIAGQLAAGKSAEAIVEQYIEQYGMQILSAPDRTGFNLFGFLVPFIVTIAGLAALTLVLRGWTRATAAAAASAAGTAAAAPLSDPTEKRYRDRIEEELKDIQV